MDVHPTKNESIGIDPYPYGGFLSHRGTPKFHAIFHRIFHEINHPASLGYPHDYVLTPIWIHNCVPLILDIMFNQIFPLRIWHTKTQTHHEFHQCPYIFESLKDIVKTVSGDFSVSREYLLRDERKINPWPQVVPTILRQLKAIWISSLSNHWYRIDTLQPDMTQWPLKGPFSSMADSPQPHPTLRSCRYRLLHLNKLRRLR